MKRTPQRLRSVSPAPKPVGGLLDRDPVTGAHRFVYIPAAATNVAATIERVRREIAEGKRPL